MSILWLPTDINTGLSADLNRLIPRLLSLPIKWSSYLYIACWGEVSYEFVSLRHENSFPLLLHPRIAFVLLTCLWKTKPNSLDSVIQLSLSGTYALVFLKYMHSKEQKNFSFWRSFWIFFQYHNCNANKSLKDLFDFAHRFYLFCHTVCFCHATPGLWGGSSL